MSAVDSTAIKRIGEEFVARPSITYWVRGEPDPRSDATDALIEPLRARVRDPVWFLTRQWQLGEFTGADSGSPAYVALSERTGKLTTWATAGQGPVALTVAPLEQQCEREPFTPDIATRVEFGQTFEQLLADAGQQALIDSFRTAYPVADSAADPSDLAEVRFRLVVGARAIDGLALLAAADAATPALPSNPAVPAASQAAVLTALNAFRQWVQDTLGATGSTDPSAWTPSRLEYSLQLNGVAPSGQPISLQASPGSDGMLDWVSLDLQQPNRSVSAAARFNPSSTTRAVIPAHVRFRGAPNARFWDFELAQTDLGSLMPDKRDLARLAIMDFVLVHANDWFVIPIDMAPGDLYQIDELIVRDVFGTSTLVQRADRETATAGAWSLFTTSIVGQSPANTADFFLLAPSAASALQSGPTLEEVRFARDEIANMVWALEQYTENGIGSAWSGHERDIARNVPAPGAPVPAPPPSLPGVHLRYAIESPVPEHWIPFLPVSLDPSAGTVALERAAMLRDDGTPIQPAGRILRPSSIAVGTAYQLPEEEVARTGVAIRRVVCFSRWVDGSSYLWVMRDSGPSSGGVNSALRFDQAVPTP
jgi:hypothetical protein